MVCLTLVTAMVLPTFFLKTEKALAASNITTTATGYKKASDVKYVTSGGNIANWGARGEASTFLSKYAESFYTGSYEYDALSLKSGGSTQSNASSSALYSSLKTLMSSKHSHQTSYGETKNLYRFTDCVSSNYTYISSFYSGTQLTGTWNYPEWNREHTWPNSKGLGGKDEDDIMMIRPTSHEENGTRGNIAYGEGASFYHSSFLFLEFRRPLHLPIFFCNCHNNTYVAKKAYQKTFLQR